MKMCFAGARSGLLRGGIFDALGLEGAEIEGVVGAVAGDFGNGEGEGDGGEGLAAVAGAAHANGFCEAGSETVVTGFDVVGAKGSVGGSDKDGVVAAVLFLPFGPLTVGRLEPVVGE